MRLPPIAEMLRQLRCAETSSRELIERCLHAIEDAAGEGARSFTRVFAESARREADTADAALRQGRRTGPLMGVPVSVKDLFDVAGEVTTAGSFALAEAEPAMTDAVVVQRLRTAGAIVLGRTNMTEFAYSGLGLNPHFGTPRNPFERELGRIPGGSSSGAAVAVADGMCSGSVGTDTGGSVRIPAALCGLAGFKPTARRVPQGGMLPLAPSLDSIGPIAPTVDCCARIDRVLADGPERVLPECDLSSLQIGIMQGYVLDDLDETVGRAYERAINLLAEGGATLTPLHFPELERVPAANQFAAAEAYAWHRSLLQSRGELYDPHVARRIRYGASLLAADYLDMLRQRREMITLADAAFDGYDAVLLPTTPWIAPAIAPLEASDAAYFEANGAMLRNPSLANYLDGCAVSIPCHEGGEAPVGLMVMGLREWDDRVLRVSAAIEAALTWRRT